MAVDAKTVRDVAHLARLQVSDSEVETLAAEMTTILEFMGTIGTWCGEPESGRTPAARRPDIPRSEAGSKLISASAHVEENAVVVPPVKGAS